MAIASQEQAVDLQNRKPRYWHIVSISGRLDKIRPRFPNALSMCSLFFDDVEFDLPGEGLYKANPVDIRKAIEFCRQIGDQPLLIHCHAGISRSTAMAWLIVFDKMRAQRFPVRRSFEIVRRLRPELMPNTHLLRIGMEVLVGDIAARQRIQREFTECITELQSTLIKPIRIPGKHSAK